MIKDTIATSIKQYLPKVLQSIGPSRAKDYDARLGLSEMILSTISKVEDLEDMEPEADSEDAR